MQYIYEALKCRRHKFPCARILRKFTASEIQRKRTFYSNCLRNILPEYLPNSALPKLQIKPLPKPYAYHFICMLAARGIVHASKSLWHRRCQVLCSLTFQHTHTHTHTNFIVRKGGSRKRSQPGRSLKYGILRHYAHSAHYNFKWLAFDAIHFKLNPNRLVNQLSGGILQGMDSRKRRECSAEAWNMRQSDRRRQRESKHICEWRQFKQTPLLCMTQHDPICVRAKFGDIFRMNCRLFFFDYCSPLQLHWIAYLCRRILKVLRTGKLRLIWCCSL